MTHAGVSWLGLLHATLDGFSQQCGHPAGRVRLEGTLCVMRYLLPIQAFLIKSVEMEKANSVFVDTDPINTDQAGARAALALPGSCQADCLGSSGA